jgi:transcriptional regulator with XRE-family HTH domain
MKNTDTNFKIRRVLFKLRLYRELKKLTQTQVAQETGVGLRTYQRIESGEASCDIDFLFRYCHFLEIKLEHLLSLTVPELHSNIKLFNTESEQFSFTQIPAIKDSHFLSLANHLQENNFNLENVANGPEFQFFPQMLTLFTLQNRFFNKLAIEESVSEEIAQKSFPKIRDINYFTNIVDNLYYHLPVYSIVNPTKIIVTKNGKSLTGFNRHYYTKENEVITISLLKYNEA